VLIAFLSVLPIFSVMALGYASVRFRLIGERTGEGLADYVFVIAIPVLLFRSLATAKLPDVQPWPFWISYFAVLAAVWAIATICARVLFARSREEGVVAGISTGYANLVLIGIPLTLRVFGEEGTIPLFLLIAIHTPVTIAIATLLVESAATGSGKALAIGRKLARNPIILGILAGVAWRALGPPLPEPILATLKFIGDSAAPGAIFAMGAALNRYGFGGEPRLLALIISLKLLIHPFGVWLLASQVFGLPPVWTAVATVLAACPCGLNAYLFAERNKVGLALASGAIAISTVLSVVTITFWISFVKG
jgi:malonate transporter